MNKTGTENPYAIRTELRAMMDAHAGVFRTASQLEKGLEILKNLKDRFQNVAVLDKSRVYNTNLINVLETENLILLAEILLKAALNRTESRGAHARNDYSVRDDDNWLKHTLVYSSKEGFKISYKPVDISKWKPIERKY